MTNKKLALTLYFIIILIVSRIAIYDLMYGGLIAGFYAFLSLLSIILTIFPVWISISVFFKASTLSEITSNKKILIGWFIFLFCIPTNYITTYMNMYDVYFPSTLKF